MEMVILNITVIVIGLILGSFINVLAYRLPNDMPVILSRSQCPKCNMIIPLYRNIPIITYVIQNGRCHNCKNKISINYFIVELIIGIIWIFGAVYYNQLNEAMYYNIISSLLLAIAYIDKKYFIIPLELSISIFIIILSYLFIFDNILENFNGIIYGLGYLSFIFILTKIITKRQGLGYGDLQLIFILGFWISDIRILLVIFLSALFALLIWIFISIKDGFDKNRALPFGTFLTITSIIIYPFEMEFLLF